MTDPTLVSRPLAGTAPVPSELALGDIDRSRATDAADAVRWFRAMRIPIHTYAVTDDEQHLGVGLPRRGWDGLVKTISPHCLRERFGLPVDPFPPELVPGIKELADACQAIPSQYFRVFAERGFVVMLADDLGRLAKTWVGDVDGVPHRLRFFHRDQGYAGRLSDRIADDGKPEPTHVITVDGTQKPDAWAWEPVTSVRFDEGSGEISFERRTTGDRWRGTVDDVSDGYCIGSTMEVTVTRRDGSTVDATLTAQHPAGGTFAANGFGFGREDECREDEWTIGHTPRAIIMNPAAARQPFTIAHEMGHMVEYVVTNGLWLFDDADLATFSRVFVGGSDAVAAGTSPLPGSGYVTAYAASGTEDVSETYGYLLADRTTLAQRLAEERTKERPALARKVLYLSDRVHVPDPGPGAAAPFGEEGRTVVFMTRGEVRMWTGGRVSVTPLGRSHHTVTAVADAQGGVRAIVVGTDLRVRHARYAHGAWGPLQELGASTRVPVAASRTRAGHLVLFVVDRAGFVEGHVIDELTGQRVDSFVLRGLRTDDRVAAAGGQQRLCLAATDEHDVPHVMWMDGSLTPTRWEPMPGRPVALREGVSAVVAPAGDPPRDRVHVLGLDDRYRIRVQVLNGPGEGDGWRGPAQDFVAASTPVLTRRRLLVATGLSSGAVYRTRWGTDDRWERIDGL